MAVDRRAASPRGIVLDAVNKANGTDFNLTDMQVIGIGDIPDTDKHKSRLISSRADGQYLNKVITYPLIDLATVIPEGTLVDVHGVTFMDLLVDLNRICGTYFTAETLTFNDFVVSASKKLQYAIYPTGGAFVDVVVKATPGSVAYRGQVGIKVRLAGPLLYPPDAPTTLIPLTLNEKLQVATKSVSGTEAEFATATTGLLQYNRPFNADIMTNWGKADGSHIHSKLMMSGTELDEADAGTPVTIAGQQCYLNFTYSKQTTQLASGSETTACLTASISYAATANRALVKTALRNFSQPQGFMYLLLWRYPEGPAHPTSYSPMIYRGYTTLTDDDAVDVNFFFMNAYQNGGPGSDSGVNFTPGVDWMKSFQIVNGSKYHTFENSSFIGHVRRLDHVASVLDDGNFLNVEASHARSNVVAPGHMLPATNIGANDQITGLVPNLANGGTYTQVRPATPPQWLEFTEFPDARCGFLANCEYRQSSNGVLKVVILHKDDLVFDFNADQTKIKALWAQIQTYFNTKPDWNAQTGVVAMMLYSKLGMQWVYRTLFNPKIYGNAIVFEGKVDYGNSVLVRNYTGDIESVILANATNLYPN